MPTSDNAFFIFDFFTLVIRFFSAIHTDSSYELLANSTEAAAIPIYVIRTEFK